METKSEWRFGGIPTAPDVKLICAKYPRESLTVGRRIAYNEIAATINEAVDSNRFRTVTNAWRRTVERDWNVLIVCDNGSFKVCSEPEKVDVSRGKLHSAVKATRRSMIVSAIVDISALDKKQLEDHEFNVRKAAAVIGVGKIRSASKLPELKS